VAAEDEDRSRGADAGADRKLTERHYEVVLHDGA